MIRTTMILAAVAAMAAGAATAQPAPRAKIETGALVGVAYENANVFRNIPFAAPPVGELRWAPPQPPKPWAGDRAAATQGVSCPQPMTANDMPNSGGANGPTSEDCLQLNVFAPKTAKKAPVMVWIHGGSHRTGAGWVYDGQNFARDGVVLMSIIGSPSALPADIAISITPGKRDHRRSWTMPGGGSEMKPTRTKPARCIV